jgi:hypothetical protein
MVSLMLQHMGIPKGPVLSMFSTLQHLVHCILMTHSISQDEYGGIWQELSGKLPLMGVIQGNGAGPTTWLIISSLFFCIMKKCGHRARLVATITQEITVLLGFAIMDDANLFKTSDDINTQVEEIIPEFQQMILDWSELLDTTGGSGEPSKTFYYIVDFKWTGQKWHYQTKKDVTMKVVMRGPDGQLKVISRLKPSKSEETLGLGASKICAA